VTLASEDIRPVPAGLLERVAASAAGIGAVNHLGAKVKRHRARGERTVLEYRFDGGLRLFAKRYPQRRDALVSYDMLRVLWKQGFGTETPRSRRPSTHSSSVLPDPSTARRPTIAQLLTLLARVPGSPDLRRARPPEPSR